MSVLFVLVPVALALAACAVFAYTWSSRNGQFDDLTTPALRAILDEAPNRTNATPSVAPSVAPSGLPSASTEPQRRDAE